MVSQAMAVRTATGAFVAEGLQGELTLFALVGAGDAATCTLRTGGSSGTVLANLGVTAAKETANLYLLTAVHFNDGLHITLDTGTTPKMMAGWAGLCATV